MSKISLSPRAAISKLNSLLPILRHYSLAVFVIFVAVLYGFIALRINSLGNIEPSPDAVTSQVQTAQIPRIDQSVVNQLQSLQDNSVSVQALFNQARSNPFQ